MQYALEWSGGKTKLNKEEILAIVFKQMQSKSLGRSSHKGSGIEARSVNRLDMSAQRSSLLLTPLPEDRCDAQKETLAHRKPISENQAKTIAETRMSEDGSPTLPAYLTSKKQKTELNPR